jgi:hypothetical protein
LPKGKDKKCWIYQTSGIRHLNKHVPVISEQASRPPEFNQRGGGGYTAQPGTNSGTPREWGWLVEEDEEGWAMG